MIVIHSLRQRIPLGGVLLLGGSLLGATALPGQTPDTPAGIVARVVDSAGTGVGGAEVLLVNTVHRTTSDSTGLFRLRLIPPGEYLLQVRRVGYEPRYLRVPLAPGEAWGGQVILRSAPVTLPEVVATVPNPWNKPAHLMDTRKYDDFYRRRRAGRGAFFDRAEIEKNHWDRFGSLTEMVDRMGVPGTRGIGVARCEDSSFMGGGRVLLFLDGNRDRAQIGPNLLPSAIEAIEIYRGASQIPAEFGAAGGVCAVISIWTR